MIQALGFALNQSPLRHPLLFTHKRRALVCATHPGAIALVASWRQCARDGGMRLGTHFPSRRWARVLPHVALLEKVRQDFRVRLAGFGLFCFHGHDLAGKLLSEIHKPADFAARKSELDRVLAAERPHIGHRSVHCGGETVLEREVVSLPVLAADARTRLVMSVSFWMDRGRLN